VKETINIPKGVDNNVNLRVSKKGNSSVAGPPGDLLVTVRVRPDSYFRRDGSDIHTDLFLSIS
jgi:DnaJ-class molecular chaperone